MARVKAKVLGRDAVMAQLRALAPEIEKRLAVVQLSSMVELAEKIRARAPVGKVQNRRPGRRPGTYRRSIRADKLANNPGDSNRLRGIANATKDPNAAGIYGEFLWHWLEFGSVNNVARPHIFPTYRQQKKLIKARMRSVVTRAMKRRRAAAAEAAVSEDIAA
jgi:hypothetical protein